jgi:peroxiredoxin
MTLALLMCIVILLTLVLGAVGGLAFFLVREHRHLTRRLDLLEQEPKGGSGAHPAPGSSVNAGVGELRLPNYLPSFRFSDLHGESVGLDEFVGRKVLLIHWNPHCGFCELIAPELGRVATDLVRQGVAIVFICHGDRETNRRLVLKYGLQVGLLFPEDSEQGSRLFQGRGTPAAYLLEEDGSLAYPLTVGADAVLHVAKQAGLRSARRTRLTGERPLEESRIERQGLKPGAMAPSFSLPNVFGGTITLEEYRGRRAILLFTDLGCGPCNELFPEFKRLYQERGEDTLPIILVGRGDPTENRRKLEEHGLALPLVVQRGWEISRRYGIFAIPVAFLIDENGLVADKIAKGPLEIRKMIREEQGRATRLQV